MEYFFDNTNAGAGLLIRQQTTDIVINNIYWIAIKEQEIMDAFFVPDPRQLQ